MATASPSGPLQNASQAAKAHAGGMWNDATAGVAELTGALRNAAEQIDGGRNPTTARFARQAAEGLDRFSSSLQGKDLEAVLRETERFARSQPALFLGAAVAAGFLAMRFLKASSPEDGGFPSERDFQGGFDAPDTLP